MVVWPTQAGGGPPAYSRHSGGRLEPGELIDALVNRVTATQRRNVVRGDGTARANDWPSATLRDVSVAAAGVPFGVRAEAPVGVLVAWRAPSNKRPTAFGHEELLVLEMLADYAAVALETARISREAAAAEARRQADQVQQQSLRISEERFRCLVHNASDLLLILSP